MVDIIPLTKNRKKVIRFEKKDSRKKGKIINITSAKGGVGRSIIASNLSYLIAQKGVKCLLVDGCYGLGNIDVLEGLAPKFNLSHVNTGQKSIEDILINNLGRDILPAACGVSELTKLQGDLNNLIYRFSKNYEITIIDSPAGIDDTPLGFIEKVDENIIVTLPEPSSITNNYALMKVSSIENIKDKFKLLVNMAYDKREGQEVYKKLSLVTDSFLDVNINYLGHLSYDSEVKTSVKRQKILSELNPDSQFSKDLERIVLKLI